MEKIKHEYWNILEHVAPHIREEFHSMMEEYISHLPKGDEALLREHYLPVTKIYMRMRDTLSGIGKTDDQVLEDAVRELCVGQSERKIQKVFSILNKVFKHIEPRFFKMMTGRESSKLRSDVCIPGSNCHYRKEFLINRNEELAPKPVLDQAQDNQKSITITILSGTTYDHLSATKVIEPIKLCDLEPIKIIELAPGIVYSNKVIFCTQITNGYMMTSYHTVVEDDFGQCAKLCIYNITPEMRGSLKQGVKMAIANPYYKIGQADEFYIIRVESPEEIIILDMPQDSNEANSGEFHKIEGNKYLQDGDLDKAIVCYTRAINTGDEFVSLYLINRSLCHLKNGSFEYSLRDAEAAIEIDPNNSKYRYRLAMAWSGLGDHEKSLDILNDIEVNPNRIAAIAKEQKLLDNSKGKIDFEEISGKASSGEEIEIADFIGPIKIGTSHKNGHGIFSTRDIKRGEIISVTKAIAYVGPNKQENLEDLRGEYTIFADHIAISKTRASSKLNDSLTNTIIKSKLSAFRIFSLHDKHLHNEPISIEIYGSKGYELVRDKDRAPYQQQQIRTIIQYNALSYHHPDHLHNEYMHTHGIWLIRAYLNHSCMPNTSLTFYRDVCIIFANHDIATGVELTAPPDPKNKELLERAKLLREKADRLTELKYNPNHATFGPDHFELLNQIFALAEEMQLGPNRYNTAIWQAIHNLISSLPEPEDYEKFLQILYRCKSLLCDTELGHQFALWKRWIYFNYSCNVASPECIDEVLKRYAWFDNFVTNIP
ncbi:hypothetical protein LOD99_4279 [Oopsacas minuta]|uniref:SET domain-containing protein n=1 Tax=Oopsacas minuta TaxID=111878 RepID=A0AAV7JVC7_9METZ|nr:hypothetical protein LOD99_4279 [Oopsacas minuta]